MTDLVIKSGRVLIESDLAEIAALHLKTLPTSALSLVGVEMLKAYYDFVRQSPHESLFAATWGASVVGAAVLSYRPFDLARRLAFRAPLRIMGAVFVRPLGVMAAARKISGNGDVPASLRGLPETVQIFTSSDFRRHGVARALLVAQEAELLTRRRRKYFVRTEASTINGALPFYRREGFRPAAGGASGPAMFLEKEF